MSLLRKIACLTMIGMMMFGLPAYAEVQCPEHAETFENPSDGSVLCVVLEGEDAGVIVAPIVTDDSVEPGQALDDDASYSEVLAQQDSDGSATVYLDETFDPYEYDRALDIILDYELNERILSGGFSLDGGIGYAIPSAVAFRISASYSFEATESDTGFSLFADLYATIGYPSYLGAFVVPSFYIVGNQIKLTFGWGAGVLYYFNASTADEVNPDNKKTFFAFKPTVRFDWFFVPKVYFGVGIEFPLSVELLSKDDQFHPHFNLFVHGGSMF